MTDPIFASPIVITNRDYRFLVKEQLAEIGVEATIVIEPARRDSGPVGRSRRGVGGAGDPESTVAVFASDHVITKRAEFLAACVLAADAAEQGFIVTHLGRAPGRTGDRRRLHQARPGDRRRARIGDRCVCREAGARRRRTLRRGGLSLEFGQFLFSRRRDARRVEGFSSPKSTRRQKGRSKRPDTTSASSLSTPRPLANRRRSRSIMP